MIIRDIKRILKKNSVLRQIGWWLEINVLSQISKKKDEFEIKKELKARHNQKMMSENDRKITEYKNLYSGQECIIIGNGPSLLIEDLEMINSIGVISFGLNRVNALYDKTKWRPTFLVMYDHRFLISGDSTINIEEYVQSVQDERTKQVFFRKQIRKYFNQKLNKKILYFRMPLKNCYQIEPTSIKGDISLQLEDLGTVTAAAIEVALYMGFSKIYLYGQDFKYRKYIDIDGNHVDTDSIVDYAVGMSSKEEKYKEGYHDLRKAFLGFKQCWEYAKKNSVEIINLTHGGNLKVFERKEFNDIFFE